MNKPLKTIQEYAMITLGISIIATSVYFILMPSHLIIASISGLAIILANFIPFPLSAITMVLNVVLLIIGILFIGKEFGGKTIYTSILLPIIIGIYEVTFPNVTAPTDDPFLNMICYIFIVSIGLAILFNRNASSGGLDIVAKLMNKYLHMELGNAMSVAGMVVALSSIFVYDTETLLLSVLGTYLNGIVLDHFIFGSNLKKRVCIVSKKEEEIRNFILHDLHSGATIYQAIGAYNLEPKTEIITIVDKNEYVKLMNFIEKTDSDAFVTIYTVSNIIYRPKV